VVFNINEESCGGNRITATLLLKIAVRTSFGFRPDLSLNQHFAAGFFIFRITLSPSAIIPEAAMAISAADKCLAIAIRPG